MKRKAFTLIELLVVIAILALLVSILIPSVSKAKELAKRVACSANLKGWHTAIAQYNTEYDYLPGSWGNGGGPSVFWSDTARKMAGAAPTPEISFEKMSDYLPGFDPDNNANVEDWNLYGAWVCLAVCKQAKIANPGWFQGKSTHFHYSYYARVSEWSGPKNNGPGTPRGTADIKDYVDIDIGGQRLLMSDMILCRRVYGGGAGFWLYNHGNGGAKPVYSDKTSHAVKALTYAKISGLNQLYGNGSVEWVPKSRTAFDDLLRYRTGEHDHGAVRD